MKTLYEVLTRLKARYNELPDVSIKSSAYQNSQHYKAGVSDAISIIMDMISEKENKGQKE